MTIKQEESVREFIHNVFHLNSFDTNIFTNHHWFIFLNKEDSLGRVFRYDSNVFLVIGDKEGEDEVTFVETYSIEEGVEIKKYVGTWSATNVLGKA